MSALVQPEWTPKPVRLYGGQHAGKVVFDTKSKARRALQLWDRKGMKPYRCAVCGRWHVGHPTKAAK